MYSRHMVMTKIQTKNIEVAFNTSSLTLLEYIYYQGILSNSQSRFRSDSLKVKGQYLGPVYLL